jgi:hypothetical protein
MERQTQKKEWKTPELIVLVRSKPEEAVLTGCKWVAPLIGPSSMNANCAQEPSCVSCDGVSLS